MDTISSARRPYQAGRFYPADKEELRETVRQFLNTSSVYSVKGVPKGFAVPHAGYSFSGATAGCAYRQMQEIRPDLVVLLAPSHHANFPYVSCWEGSAYSTPLGDYPIDRDAIPRLMRHLPGMASRRWAEEIEHSLEVQVPFLQVACPKAKMLPLLLGAQDKRNIAAVGKALTAFCEGEKERSIILIASSDAYHGHSLDQGRASDSRLARILEGMDADSLLSAVESKETMACGYGSLAVVMQTASSLGARTGTVLSQTSSAEVIPYREGDYVVGYLSVMFS